MNVMPRSIGALMVLLAACTSTPRTPTAASSSPGTSTTSSPTLPTPTKSYVAPSLTRGFVVVDMTWVSDEIGWVLGGRGCAAASCARLLRTDDGGLHWRRLGAPPAFVLAKGQYASKGCPPSDCVSHIRFANTRVGYAFGSTLFITTDGGRSWQKQPTPPYVDSLEISHGVVYRVAYSNSGCPGPCGEHVDSAPTGSTSWHRILTPMLYGNGSVVVEGSRIYLAQFGNTAGGAGSAHALFSRSLDGGRTWTTFDDPCGSDARGENDALDFAAAPVARIVVRCEARFTSSQAEFLVLSSDAGTTFGSRHVLPLEEYGALQISAGSSHAFLVLFSRGDSVGVLMSDDARTWEPTLTVKSPPERERGGGFLGFQDPRTARVAFGDAYIWTTRDAGRTWRQSSPFAT